MPSSKDKFLHLLYNDLLKVDLADLDFGASTSSAFECSRMARGPIRSSRRWRMAASCIPNGRSLDAEFHRRLNERDEHGLD